MPGADRTAVIWRLAVELARSRTEGEAALAISGAAARFSGADSVRVWMIDRHRGYRLAGSWPEGANRPESPAVDVVRTIVFGSSAASRAEPPFRSRLTIPLMAHHRPLGAIELLERARESGVLQTGETKDLSHLSEAADAALQAGREESSRQSAQLAAITRLTRLFDLGTTITGTLEMEKLPGIIVNRIQASLDAEAVYLWLLEDGQLTVAAAVGTSRGSVEGWRLSMGEGAAGQVAENRQAKLWDDAEEIPGFADRPDRGAGLEIHSLIAVPMLRRAGEIRGVLEVIRGAKSGLLEEGDLQFLKEVAGTAARALGNAQRLDADRRATDLEALLKTAQELGSTLDVPKVSFTLVHRAAAVLKYRQAAVGLYRGAGLELVAVSGQTFVDATAPKMKALRDILTWAAALDEGTYVVQEEDGTIDADRPETREKFRAYFELTGHRSFLAVPLRDEDGRLGVFAMEGTDPYAFSQRALLAATLLATQATVAIRNATLYEQIPMARVFRPLAGWKRRFSSLPFGRRMGSTAILALVSASLLVPVPLRVGGSARVLSDHRVPVTAEVAGRVARVFVREGTRVEAGQILAQLDDTDYRAGREEAHTRLEISQRERNRLRAETQTAAAGVEAARIEGLDAEVHLWETRLANTQIRSRTAGIVATPRIEEVEGTVLKKGDILCEVVDPSKQLVEVAVSERDVGLLRAGMPVKVKIFAYPEDSFEATVARIGVVATQQEEERVFLVQATLNPATRVLKSELTGQAKISTGWASLGRVLFRRPWRWIREVIWRWWA